MHDKRSKNHSGQQILLKRNITEKNTVGHTYTTPVTHTRPIHAHGQTWDTLRRPCEETQCSVIKTTRNAYGQKYEREAGEIIKNIVQ